MSCKAINGRVNEIFHRPICESIIPLQYCLLHPSPVVFTLQIIFLWNYLGTEQGDKVFLVALSIDLLIRLESLSSLVNNHSAVCSCPGDAINRYSDQRLDLAEHIKFLPREDMLCPSITDLSAVYRRSHRRRERCRFGRTSLRRSARVRSIPFLSSL